jgi:putative oxidoreductase
VNLSRLALRLTMGTFLMGHGLQKLAGWFGGPGPSGTAQFFESIGLRPSKQNAIAAGVAETKSGALLAAGLATPAAGALVTAVQLTAVHRVHWRNGPWVASGGFEYNAVLIAAALLLVEIGPGDWSLDHALGIERKGTGWALAAFGAGILGAIAAHVSSERAPQPEGAGEGAADEAAPGEAGGAETPTG